MAARRLHRSCVALKPERRGEGKSFSTCHAIEPLIDLGCGICSRKKGHSRATPTHPLRTSWRKYRIHSYTLFSKHVWKRQGSRHHTPQPVCLGCFRCQSVTRSADRTAPLTLTSSPVFLIQTAGLSAVFAPSSLSSHV